MHCPRRIPVVFAVIAAVLAAVACSSSDGTVMPKLSPVDARPMMQRIRASDSLLALTDIAYSDTAVVLKRLAPLAADVTASALIGPEGGSLVIDAAGAKLSVPAGALTVPTQITMTALHGYDVAYEFAPHGLQFLQPVKVQQDLRQTVASLSAAALNGLHGGYYDTSLDSSYVNPLHLQVRVKENELAYKENNNTQLKFYVGHFSGYLVCMGDK